ncbi:hypothetical protein HAX54_052857, partial [Datura stramonium]|nr:hypothetical protein [Datura stramonium]
DGLDEELGGRKEGCDVRPMKRRFSSVKHRKNVATRKPSVKRSLHNSELGIGGGHLCLKWQNTDIHRRPQV